MVSIIIPAYNVEKYIRECLDSALGQTYSDIELVVVDDGSTDSTPAIIREYAARDPRIRPVSRPNGGLSAARNTGLAAASGRWVTFLDSDDVLAPMAVRRLVEAARQSGASYVECSRTEGPDSSRISWPETSSDVMTVFDAEAYIEKVLYQDGVYPTVWGKLFARDLFDGLSFREGILYEDLDIFYRLAAKAGRIAVVPDRLYFYRRNPSGLTGSFSPRRLDVLDVTERIEAFVGARFPRLLPAARDRRLSAAFNMFGLIAVNDSDGRHAQASAECWSLIRRYRRGSLFNRRVRLKNKAGIIISYFGPAVLRLFVRKFYEGRIR